MKQITKKFKGKVAYYYKFFPVRSHKRGVPSALAGLAAARQGKFWKMYDLLYANKNHLEDSDLEKYAKQAGLDMARFKADIKNKELMKQIEKDKLLGMRLGVDGTPTYFINGKMYVGLNEYPELIDRIGEEIDITEGLIK
jgi:protein-disulfide isomerase